MIRWYYWPDGYENVVFHLEIRFLLYVTLLDEDIELVYSQSKDNNGR